MNIIMKDKIIGIVAKIMIDNIDTDQIIPTEFLKSIKKFGFGEFLFDGWRYQRDGDLDTPVKERGLQKDFILNQQPFDKAKILLVGDNFGCGSSREHAVWALRDFGIEAVISTSFGDIFYNNCFKNSVLAIKLQSKDITKIESFIKHDPHQIIVSLVDKTIMAGKESITFNVEDSLINRIIHNQDDIDITMKDAQRIKDFEANHLAVKPWL
jgi:3-isopropylmalate/(R)-2-methylmalate dehydratase small subunit